MKLSYVLCVLATLWHVSPAQEQPPLVLDAYDVLVVGAGLSGAVLAERHISLGLSVACSVFVCA